MLNLSEEQLSALISAGNDVEEIKRILSLLKAEELIEILDALNSIIKLIEMNQYARLKREDE